MRLHWLVLCLFAAITAEADPKSFTIPKDAQAVAVVQQAMTAMGAVALVGYQDSQATGTLAIYGSGSSSTTYSVTLKCKGTQETRTELQMPNGTTVRIVNGGLGVIERPDGTIRRLTMNNTIVERVGHIPLLSILGEYVSGNVGVQYEGTVAVNGQNTSVVAITYVPTTDPNQAPIFASITQTLFYVDQATGLIDKIQCTNYDENDPNITQKIEVYLSNYQTVNGISLPFHQTTYADGTLSSDLMLSSISFNVGLPDSQFTLPQ